jgi:hypothetical protein
VLFLGVTAGGQQCLPASFARLQAVSVREEHPAFAPTFAKNPLYVERTWHAERHNPLFRYDESVQEVRSIENAPTRRRRRQQHPHWYICPWLVVQSFHPNEYFSPRRAPLPEAGKLRIMVS